MSVYDRWHTKTPRTDPATGKPVERCREHKQYPSVDHGKGDRWQVRWRDDNGKQCKQNFAKRDGKNPAIHADAYDKKIQGELLAGTYIDPNAGKVSFEEYATKTLANRTLDPLSRLNTERAMKNYVYPVIGRIELATLARRPSLIQELVRSMEAKGLAPKTISRYMSSVGVVFTCGVEDGAILRNPCSSKIVTLPEEMREEVTPWTKEQVLAVRAAIERRYSAMVDIGAGLGLRQGEIFGLSPADIDWVRRVVRVRRQVKLIGGRLVFAPPKGRKSRTVPLEELLGIRLGEHLEEFPARPVTLPWVDPRGGELRTVELFFTSLTGKGLRSGYFNSRYWWPALEKAGIVPPVEAGEERDADEHGMHALRHYFASALLTEGESVKAVSVWMGHHSLTVTANFYAHLMPQSETRMRTLIGRALSEDPVPAPEAGAQNVPAD